MIYYYELIVYKLSMYEEWIFTSHDNMHDFIMLNVHLSDLSNFNNQKNV